MQLKEAKIQADKQRHQDQYKNLELIVKRSPKLLINVIDSQGQLPKGHFLTLNALGVETQ